MYPTKRWWIEEAVLWFIGCFVVVITAHLYTQINLWLLFVLAAVLMTMATLGDVIILKRRQDKLRKISEKS